MKTIEEKNRMIAEFMGFKDTFVRNHKGIKYDYDLPNGFELIKEVETTIEGEWCEILMEQDRCMASDLKFHTSWEWLMPVVEKIEDIGYWFTYLKPNSTDVVCLIGKIVDNSSTPWKYKEFMEYVGGIKKQATYNAVVKFIEWYNENKKL